MTENFSSRTIRLTPLSPIHLGTGEDVNWLNAAVLDDKSGPRLYRFRPETLKLAQSAHRKLFELGEQAINDERLDPIAFIRQAQNFLKSQSHAIKSAAWSYVNVAPKLARKLEKGGGTPKEAINEVAIAEIALDPRSGWPVIPGSAIKGTLKTSWLDHLRDRVACPVDRNGDRYVSELLGGKFNDDPFSQVLVDDFRPQEITVTAAIVAQNVKRADSGKPARGVPLNLLAMLPSSSSIIGNVRIVRRLGSQINTPKIEELLSACHKFHLGIWNTQLPQMKNHAPRWWLDAMGEIVKTPNIALIRLGKFATAESKTTRDRNIAVRVAKNGPPDWRKEGTTFWLAGDDKDDGGIPFGWALLEWQDGPTSATALVDSFSRSAPWAELLVTAADVGSPANEIIAPSEIQNEIEFLKAITQLDRKYWTENHLKNLARNAHNVADESERQRIREWLLENYKSVIKPAFKQADFEKRIREIK